MSFQDQLELPTRRTVKQLARFLFEMQMLMSGQTERDNWNGNIDMLSQMKIRKQQIVFNVLDKLCIMHKKCFLTNNKQQIIDKIPRVTKFTFGNTMDC